MKTGHSVKMYYHGQQIYLFKVCGESCNIIGCVDYVIFNFLALSVCLMSSFNRSV